MVLLQGFIVKPSINICKMNSIQPLYENARFLFGTTMYNQYAKYYPNYPKYEKYRKQYNKIKLLAYTREDAQKELAKHEAVQSKLEK